MSRYDFYQYYPASNPIETDKGIKARSKRGKFAQNWWATKWIDALERLVDKGRLQRGRRYARAGQVTALQEKKGEIKAQVQGSSRTPYQITITLDPLTDKQWDQVIEILAEQALFTAQLLSGEMPDDIELVFQQAEVSLFPAYRQQLQTKCSCPDPSNPCKHIAAVHYILGEQFDEDPFLIFRLRGRDQETLLAALRTQRASEIEDEWEAEPDEPVQPLSECIANFWGDQQQVNAIQVSIQEPAVDYPLLKRLGQPTFLSESVTAQLGPVYCAVTRAAIDAVYQPTKPDEEA
ncbi:MAG: SWIM zinc finger family protein [Chloroflexota bacterium]